MRINNFDNLNDSMKATPLYIALLLSAVGFIACQHKALPAITERKALPPVLSKTVYAPPGKVQPDTLQGKTVFMARCNRCHGLPSPETYTGRQWENILLLMIPRAGIDEENAVHVRAYVMANSVR